MHSICSARSTIIVSMCFLVSALTRTEQKEIFNLVRLSRRFVSLSEDSEIPTYINSYMGPCPVTLKIKTIYTCVSGNVLHGKRGQLF
jgi:hypothetical protein